MRARRALALVLVLAATGSAAAHEAALSRYNYRDHVRPIFLRHCAGCHRPGGAAPMSLLEYQEAVPWANAVKSQLLQGRMPPFLPGDAGGPFRGARSLTAEELDVLLDWTVGATPEGEPVEVPSVSSQAGSRWSGTPPDLVLETESSVVLGADEYEKTACLVLALPLGRPRIATAFEIAPQAPSVLRRASVFLGESCADSEPLVTWLPDQGRRSLPAGAGRAIPAGASLALSLAYKKGWEDEGKSLTDRPALGVSFDDGALPLASMHVERETALRGISLRLVALFPDPGEAASEEPIRVEAMLPGEASRLLLEIDSFDPLWAEKYFFQEPVLLPEGTRIRVSPPGVWLEFLSDGLTVEDAGKSLSPRE